MIGSIAYTKSKATKSRFIQLPSRGWYPYKHLNDYPTVTAIPLDPEKQREAILLYQQQQQLLQAQAGSRKGRQQRKQNFKSVYVNGNTPSNTSVNRKQQQPNQQQQQQQQHSQLIQQYGDLLDDDLLDQLIQDEEDGIMKLDAAASSSSSSSIINSIYSNEPKISSTKLFKGDIYHPPRIETSNPFLILDASAEDADSNPNEQDVNKSIRFNPNDHLPFLQSLFPDIEETTLLILLDEAHGDVGSIVDSFLLASNEPANSELESFKRMENESNPSFLAAASSVTAVDSKFTGNDAVNDEDFEELLKQMEKSAREQSSLEEEKRQLEILKKAQEEEELKKAQEEERKKLEKEKRECEQKQHNANSKQQIKLVSDFNATIAHLTDLFPKYSKRDLTSYLDKHSYDVNATVDTLLSLESYDTVEIGNNVSIPTNKCEKSHTTSSPIKKPVNNFPTTATTTATNNSFGSKKNNNQSPPSSFQNIINIEEILSNNEPKNVATYVGKSGSSLKNLREAASSSSSSPGSNSPNLLPTATTTSISPPIERASPTTTTTTTSTSPTNINGKKDHHLEVFSPVQDYEKKLSQLKVQFPLIDEEILESFFAETNYNFMETMSAVYDVFPESKHNAKSASNFATKVRESASSKYYAEKKQREQERQEQLEFARQQESNAAFIQGKLNILPPPKKTVEIYSGVPTEDNAEFKKIEPREKRVSATAAANNHYYETVLGGHGGNTTNSNTSRNQKSYQEHRAQAEQFTKMRNACYKSAAESYMKGKPADAKALSEQGKRYEEKAREANMCASNQIFMDCNSRIGDTLRIDLHGLHVAEALDIVQQALNIHSQGEYSSGKPKLINFITGQGNHSQGGIARIKPALLSFLRECNIKFYDKGGVVEVHNI